MRDYEMMVIIRPELDEATVQATQTRIEDLVARNGGSVLRATVWGRRKLAYPLSSARQLGYRAREGLYVIYDLSLPPRATFELDRGLRLLEDILRFMLLTREEGALPAAEVALPPETEDEPIDADAVVDTDDAGIEDDANIADDEDGIDEPGDSAEGLTAESNLAVEGSGPALNNETIAQENAEPSA